MSRKKRRERKLLQEMGVTSHPNRHEDKTSKGNRDIMEERQASREDYKLDWFKPTERQKDIIYSILTNQLTAVQGSSGCGKSTTAIWQGLKFLKEGRYKRILFIKTPSEDGSDQIGFLQGSAESKLEKHMKAMRSIFHTFMSPKKLEMEEKHKRITFDIPNFVAGETFYDTFVIIDEHQKISPDTTKLLLERVHESSAVVMLGDKAQRYAAKKRLDGFTDFVDMITEVDEEGRYSVEDLMGYVELPASENMRGELSRRIVTLYEAKD